MTAALFVRLAEIYASVGALVAVAFLFFGIETVDPRAHGAYAFRPLLVPGLVVLWPLVAICWSSRSGPRGSG